MQARVRHVEREEGQGLCHKNFSSSDRKFGFVNEARAPIPALINLAAALWVSVRSGPIAHFEIGTRDQAMWKKARGEVEGEEGEGEDFDIMTRWHI